MNKEVKAIGKETPEGRLRIRQIRKIEFKNASLELIQCIGWCYRALIYIYCFLSVFGESFGVTSNNSLFFVIMSLFATRLSKSVFEKKIPQDIIFNKEIIKEIEDEILNNQEVERAK